ncbi:MAG: ATP-binding protein [Candidatus Kerfeldbacteria bacterium]|nr:ATP-binding protein [Candidatus Kerfeldbacteria bacterium]
MQASTLYDSHTIFSLRRIVITRWFLVLGFTLLGFIQHMMYNTHTVGLWVLWIVLSLVPAVYNAVYHIILRTELSARKIRSLSVAQVIVDIIFFTGIIYVTGGVTSIGFLLYVFTILMATILLSDFFVIITACAAIFCYDMMIILEYLNIFPHLNPFDAPMIRDTSAQLVISQMLAVSITLFFVGILSVFINRLIQERTAQLLVEQDTTKSLFQSLIDGIILINKDRSVILNNQTTRELLNVANDEPILLDTRRFSKAYTPLITILRDQTPHKLLDQEVVLERGGATLYLTIDSIPVRSAEGNIVFWLKVLHDDTREKQIEEVKSDFISTAAHQLRTPLAAIKWFFKMMSDGDAGPVTEKQRRLLNQAFERNEEVIETVNHLLNVSEIEQGRLQYTFTRTNAAKIIKEIVEHADLDAERSGVHVRYVQKTAQLSFIDVDVHKFRIAIQNIVDNAVKYSRAGTEVHVRVYAQEQRFIVEVEDHGIGIPQDEHDRVFMKFFRGGYAKEKDTLGSGLGLYIVKNIIIEHRGTIRFVSEQGKGTTFIMTLPIPSDRKTIESMSE